MVEYLYDAIRAVAGQEIVVNAVIADENENLITENCYFVLHDEATHEVIAKVLGNYLVDNACWEFSISPELTKGRFGRYMYCIQHDDSNLCFKQPIYLM